MTPFLQQVAAHYAKDGNLGRICFVFPNRRAMVFFGKWLGAEVASSGRPAFAPQMLTQNDFLYRLAGASQTPKLHLLVLLYDCWCKVDAGREVEPLDDFLFWGDVILGDFNDVDKYLADPRMIFTDVAQFKAMGDCTQYLNERQMAALEQFVSHFGHGMPDKPVKGRFLQMWNSLYDLYRMFNAALDSEGSWYEGKVHRSLAERLAESSVADMLAESFAGADRFVFVGLNALNECEKTVLRRMRDARVAEFCWDYSSDWIKNPDNKSSLFMAANLAEFKPAFEIDPEGLAVPEINVLSVPGQTAQAKQIPSILARVCDSVPGLETAIVLPDESQLLPVLNSIPDYVQKINVTMGYPFSGSGVSVLMEDIAQLQLHMRCKNGVWYFYHRQVWSLLSGSVLRPIMEDADRRVADEVRSTMGWYVPQTAFADAPLLSLIFTPVVTAPQERSREGVEAIEDYQARLLEEICRRLKNVPDMALELDFAADFYRTVNMVRREGLSLLPAAYFRVLTSLTSIGGDSVPFKGEPLQGLQIMGPLEMRALDFDNLIILGCNEGVFPRKTVSSSFIPPELRRGFGLPTYEYQDALWAYYFYRMIQRARKVWLVFDSCTERTRSGEESRYIRQLEMHFDAPVRRFVVKSSLAASAGPGPIPKEDRHIQAIRRRDLSASALQTYLSCPAKFFYSYVEGLAAEDEVAESLDSGMTGRIFHSVMETLYKGRRFVDRAYLKGLLAKEDTTVADLVTRGILDELKTIEVTGRNLIFHEVICSYVRKVLERDLELLASHGADSFEILGIELKRRCSISGFAVKGYIDRLDSFEPGVVRVVDYKTGLVTDKDFDINAGNAAEVVDALFAAECEDRPKIALQLYLYDLFVGQLYPDATIVNSIYQTSRLFVESVREVALCPEFCSLAAKGLDNLLAEIANPAVPFERRGDEKACKWCNFKILCGK